MKSQIKQLKTTKKQVEAQRQAKCISCDKKVDSKPTLILFNARPNKSEDTFYCGCQGWE